MQKVLVTGAAGMLGSAIAKYMVAKNDFKITGTGRKDINPSFDYIKANLLNDNEIDSLLELVKPEIIVHCAANVNINYCELHKAATYKLHVEVSKKIASYNPEKCKVIYISTDSVFNGAKGNYSLTDAPEPLNYYAATKLASEQAIINENKNSVVIRTNIYGFNQFAPGNSLFEWLYKNLNANQPVTGYSDIYFNPLYIGQLAVVVTKFSQADVTGIFNAGCKEFLSKYDFALLIAQAFSFDTSLVENGVSHDDATVVKRPKNTTLNVDSLSKILKEEYSIEDGINQLKQDFIHQKKLYA